MEIITPDNLASTGYRSLFEYIKKEGVEPALSLVEDINNIPRREILIHKTITGEECDLVTLAKKHQDIIKYLKEHKEDFVRLKLQGKIENLLACLSNNPTLIDTYLENAKMLEELKIFHIDLIDSFKFCYDFDIYRNKNNEIINIRKYYTDGIINPSEEFLKYESCEISQSAIRFSISRDNRFLLECENREEFFQFRRIMIRDFNFDSSKLPSEEELQSYEIPKQLIKK